MYILFLKNMPSKKGFKKPQTAIYFTRKFWYNNSRSNHGCCFCVRNNNQYTIYCGKCKYVPVAQLDSASDSDIRGA